MGVEDLDQPPMLALDDVVHAPEPCGMVGGSVGGLVRSKTSCRLRDCHQWLRGCDSAHMPLTHTPHTRPPFLPPVVEVSESEALAIHKFGVLEHIVLANTPRGERSSRPISIRLANESATPSHLHPHPQPHPHPQHHPHPQPTSNSHSSAWLTSTAVGQFARAARSRSRLRWGRE